MAERVRIASEASGIPMGVAGALAGGRFAEGAGSEEPPQLTTARMDVVNRMLLSGATREAAAASVGLPVSMLPEVGQFAAGQDDQQSANVSALSGALDRLEALLPPAGEDIPGIGATGSLPMSGLSDQGRQIRSAIENAVDLLARTRSGAAVSEGERESFRQILGATGRDEELRQGIGALRRDIESRLMRAPSGQSPTERATTSRAPGMLGVR
jgi:hypothetical protein